MVSLFLEAQGRALICVTEEVSKLGQRRDRGKEVKS